jgi:hypothetical protein
VASLRDAVQDDGLNIDLDSPRIRIGNAAQQYGGTERAERRRSGAARTRRDRIV